MTKDDVYKACKAWIEAALTEVGDRVIQARQRERPPGRPAGNVPQRPRPYVTMELANSSSLSGTPYQRTTTTFTGTDPETENKNRHEIHRRRYATLHLEIMGDNAMDLAERLIDSRLTEPIRLQLRAAEIAVHTLNDPVDITEDTGTAWDERAAVDFRVHYLLTTVADAPIIETAGITLRTWQDGQDMDEDPPDHEEEFTVPS